VTGHEAAAPGDTRMTADRGRSELIIDIAQPCRDWRRAVPGVAALCRDAARAAIEACDFGLAGAELSIVLGGDALVQRLNKTWRDKDAPTNVLSFPAQTFGGAKALPVVPGLKLPLGDVVLGFETIRREAAEQGKTIDNHVVHLTVHGVLHLLGFDHATEADAEPMEMLERLVLSRLGVPDPYEISVPIAAARHG
jgi:probable rRNA maturation factor